MPSLSQRSFTAGELSPSLHSRVDLEKYATGLVRCENFIIKPQGGVYSRPGSYFVGEQADSTAKARLIPFSFNTEQTFVLVFENLKMRIIMNGGYVLNSSGNIYEISTPYTSSELDRLYYVQDADVMTLTHQNHDPMQLKRLANDNWVLEALDFSPTVPSPTGVTVAAVGNGAGTYNKTYTYVVTAIDQDGVESLPSSSVSITTNSLSITAGVKISWSAVSGATKYKVYKDPSNGTGQYGWIGTSTSTNFTDYNLAPVIDMAPPSDRRPFDGTGNKPSTVSYYQQRLVFANTYNEPQTVYTTQTGNYKSMRVSTPTRPDDAITFTIKAREVNEIRHIIPLNSMVLLTSGAEWRVTEGNTGVFSPSTVGVRPQSFNGSSWVKPVIINNNALFVQDKGTRVRDLSYQFSSDSYTGNDLSIMSRHLFEGHEIVDMAFSKEPDSVLWCIRDDGMLLGLTYQVENKVVAWHKHTTDGEYESIAVISENNVYSIYVTVKRTINGITKRYIERFMPRITSTAEDCFYVDCGLSYNGSPITTVSGLDHLEGKEVAILADGNELDRQIVVNGQVSLAYPASKIHVGLPYTATIETLDIDVYGQESLKAHQISVSNVILEVEKSRGGWVGAKENNNTIDTMLEIKPRTQSDGYDTIELKTFKESIRIKPEWSKSGGLRIEQRSPLPLAILSVTAEFDVGGT